LRSPPRILAVPIPWLGHRLRGFQINA